MATPQVSENPEVQQQYLAQLALGAAMTQSISALWEASVPMASPEALARFTNGLYVVLGQLVPTSASIAMDYYRNIRRKAGVPGTIKLRPVPAPPRSLVEADVRWATRERPEVSAADLEAAVLADIQKSITKALDDIARDQTVDAVAGDEKALGFRRVARPDACYWCIVLATRTTTRTAERSDDREGFVYGDETHFGVYKTRDAAGQLPASAGEVNRYHNDCHCTVEPIFAAADDVPGWVRDMKKLYDDSTVNSAKGQHLNDFRRALTDYRNGVTPPPVEMPMVGSPPVAAAEQIVAILDRLDAAMVA